MTLVYWLDILGTIVFAISGVLLAARKKMDIIGALVLGIVTAVGGGTIRDLILDNGVFWLQDSTDLVIAIISSFLTMLFIRLTPIRYPRKLLPILDAIGLAAFVAIGVNKSVDANANALVMVCMGVMTGVGGGVIRDVFARDVPMIFRKDIYATACIVGGVVHAISYEYLGFNMNVAVLLGMFMTLAIRLSAIEWGLSLPIIKAYETKPVEK